MDFSNLLNQEIEKKRKLGSKTGKPRFRKKTKVEVAKVELKDNDDTVESKELNEINDGKVVNEINTDAKSEVAPGSNSIGVDQGEVDEQMQEVGVESQIQAGVDQVSANEVANKEPESLDVEDNVNQTLDEQLANFDIVETNLSKQEKIDQLKQLIKIEKYKQYLSQELQLVNSPLVEADIVGNRDVLAIKIRIYLKKLIKSWELTHSQLDLLHEIKLDLIDLLYKLRKNTLPDDMITSLSTIIHYLNLHQFTQANQAYLKLSIGNVAWPIGIQNIGIHQRAADRKLTSKSANIMINDRTRRWIVSVKRLITWCEKEVNNTRA